MIEWDAYRRKRRIDVPAFIKNTKVSTYEDLIKVCRLKGVRPPSREVFKKEVEPFITVAQIPEDKAPVKSDAKKPSAPKKKTAIKKSKASEKKSRGKSVTTKKAKSKTPSGA